MSCSVSYLKYVVVYESFITCMYHMWNVCFSSKKKNNIYVPFMLDMCLVDTATLAHLFLWRSSWAVLYFRCQWVSWEPRHLLKRAVYQHRWLFPLWVSNGLQPGLHWSPVCGWVVPLVDVLWMPCFILLLAQGPSGSLGGGSGKI